MNKNSLFLLGTFIIVNLLVTVFCTPLPYSRYLCVVIVPLVSVLAYLMYQSRHVFRYCPLLLFTIYVTLSPLKKHFYEITHDYDGPIEGITKYLNEHAKPDDVVLISYEDLPVKWYTGLRTYGGLTGESFAPAKTADWIIIRKHVVVDYVETLLTDFIEQEIDPSKYKKIVLDYYDYKFENREEPRERIYQPIKMDKVAIYQRIEN